LAPSIAESLATNAREPGAQVVGANLVDCHD
jgi:hypothetical protein